MNIFISFSTSFFITFFFTPFIKRYFSKKEILDKPDFRSQHLRPIVRVGGISIYTSFIITFLIIYSLGLVNSNGIFGIFFIISIMLAASLFFIVGLIDDLINLSPFIRLFLQFFGASILYAGNIKIDVIQIPYLNSIDLPNILSYLITIVWIVGITNAINWLDGLDGLTAGTVFIYSVGLTTYNITHQLPNLAIISSILAGTCLAFLKYNKYPANIIMGDGGSNLLGFILSILSIYTFKNFDGSINLHYSLILLCVPLLDMFYVISKRILNKKSPFYPDRNHLHHRLLKIGFNDKNAVLIIYTMVFINSLLLITNIKIS